MKYIIIILILLLTISGNAQQRFPSGFPTQFNSGWNRWGYAMSDSGLIVANRDTTWLAKYSGTVVFRPANKQFYYFDSTLLRWFPFGINIDTTSLSNRINLKLNIADTVGKWLAQSTRLVDTVYRVNDSTVGYTIKGTPYTFQILGRLPSGGGSGTVTSVGLSMPSAFSVSGSPVTTSGTFSVSGAGTTAQYIRGNGTLATFDTGAIPNFYLKVRGLLSGTSPITYSTTTGAIGITNANTTGTKGAASFTSSGFSDNGSGLIDLANVVTSGACIGCNLTIDAKGRVTAFSDGISGGINNGNIGSGLRWLDSTTQKIKTVFSSNTIGWDSTSNTNGLTAKVDTSVIATQYDLTLLTGANGITRNLNTFELGGTLNQNTTINTTSAYSLNINGNNTGITTGNLYLYNSSATGTALFAETNGGYAGRFHAITSGAASTSIPVLSIGRGGGSVSNGVGTILEFKNQTTVNGFNSANTISNQLISKWTDATDATRTSQFEIWGVNSTTLARKMAISGAGQITVDGYTGTNFQTTDTSYNSLVVDGSGNIYKRSGDGGGGSGSGGGLVYIYSASAPIGIDTAKLWIRTPARAGVYDVLTYVGNQLQSPWQRFGWLSIDGIFSTNRPITILICGQSNAVGVGTGGDTAFIPGILAFTSGTTFGGGSDFQTQWATARINRSPFFSNANNIAFQVAKQLKKHGDADIVRIIVSGEGGTGLNRWITSGANYLLDSTRARIARAGVDTIDLFCWHQGESGGVTGISVGGYVVDQRVLYDTLCTVTGFFRNYTKYVAGGLGGVDSRDPSYLHNVGGPEGGQRVLNWDGNFNTGWVPSWNLSDAGDLIHFSGTAIDTMGYRYYSMFKELPHSAWQETAPFNFDETYDGYKAYVSTLVPYSGGGPTYEIMTNSHAWKNAGASYSYLTVDVPAGGAGVGNVSSMPYTGSKVLRVAGDAIISSGNYNSIIGGNFNITGTIQRMTVLGNYPTNWNLTSGCNNSVLIGTGAGYNTNRVPDNSVVIGDDAGKNFFPTGIGDYDVFVGVRAGESSYGRANAFFGATAGYASSGDGNTAIGTGTGATMIDSLWGNSTALGNGAKWDRSNQVVIGDSVNVKEVRLGKHRINVSSSLTPTSGQYWGYNNTTDMFELTSPVTGITTLNSLTAATQTFATGTTGTDFNISSSSSTHTFNIPDAGTSARGVVTTSSQTFAGVKTFNSGLVSKNQTYGAVVINGDVTSGAAPGINGIGIATAAFTYTSNAAAGTESQGQNFNLIGQPTLTSGNAITYSADVATLRLPGAPIAAGSTTISHPYNIIALDANMFETLVLGSNEQSGDQTIGDGSIQTYTGAGGNTWTLPTLSTHPGKIYFIKNAGGGNLTIQRGGSDNIYTTSSVTSFTVAAGANVIINAGGSFWYVHQ